jgi:hypothetical protein
MATTPLQREQPNEQQAKFIEVLADLNDFRPVSSKALDCGYSAEYGRALTRDPKFGEWVIARVRENVRVRVPGLYARQLRDAENDKLDPIDRWRSSRLIMQAIGEIRPANVVINDNSQTVVIGTLPERLKDHDAERRELMREVMSVDHAQVADPEAGGGSKGKKKTNGHGNGSG